MAAGSKAHRIKRDDPTYTAGVSVKRKMDENRKRTVSERSYFYVSDVYLHDFGNRVWREKAY